MNWKETSRIDGKRTIKIVNTDYGIDVHVCRNGFQTTIVTMDREMLLWLRDAIVEHLENN